MSKRKIRMTQQNVDYLMSLLLTKIRLSGIPKSAGKNIIAYSGGVDSSVAAALVHRMFPENTIAVTGISPSLSKVQLNQARDVARVIGVQHVETETSEGEKDGYIANKGNACYFCKTTLYGSLQQVHEYAAAEMNNFTFNTRSNRPNLALFNGTNSEDMLDTSRVGLVAAKEFSVISPLDEISKDQIRAIAFRLGLPNYNAAASPCLRSRLAFGIEATEKHLRAVEHAEAKVRQEMGLSMEENMRVRLLPGQRAALEVDANRLEEANNVLSALQLDLEDLGFPTICARPFKSGSVSGYAQIEKRV